MIRRYRKQWVSATATFNFMRGDPLLDWLKVWRREHIKRTPTCTTTHTTFTKFILQRGNDFEREIVKSLIKHIKQCNTIDINSSTYHADDVKTARKNAYKQTLGAMKRGVHMILSGTLMDKRTRTFGVPDILMRTDIAAAMFNILPNDDEKYIIIDVKYSTLPLKSDGVHILNSSSYPAYKAQLYVYARALSRHQLCTRAFILGRGWSYIQQGQRYFGNDPFQRLGCIDYSDIDAGFVKRTKEGIKWIRKVNRPRAEKWASNDVRLLPNMCNYKDSPWRGYKSQIAQETGELTMLWMVGVKNRDLAIKKHIMSWRDPKCSATALGIHGNRGRLLDAIININRDFAGADTSTNKDVIRPAYITHRLHSWHLAEKEYFVDFETTSGCFGPISIPSNNSNLIFMIGVGWRHYRTWKYKSFIVKELTGAEEKRICREMANFVGNSRCWHWSGAEPSRWPVTCGKINWCDLLQVWMQEPVVIATCFTFGLKDVAKAMYRHGLIQTTWDCPINSQKTGIDGLMASVLAHTNLFTSANSDLQDIINYNEVDVRTLCEMLEYLRNNMVKRKATRNSSRSIKRHCTTNNCR